MDRKFDSFKAFYPYYLSQHSHRRCRLMHFIGSFLAIIIFFAALFSKQYAYWVLIPLVGYGFAWVGHAFFEKNKPATFKYPLYSLLGDWVMFKDILLGKLSV